MLCGRAAHRRAHNVLLSPALRRIRPCTTPLAAPSQLRCKSTHHPLPTSSDEPPTPPSYPHSATIPPSPAPAAPPPPRRTMGAPRLVRYGEDDASHELGRSNSSLVRAVVARGESNVASGLFGIFPSTTVNALAHESVRSRAARNAAQDHLEDGYSLRVDAEARSVPLINPATTSASTTESQQLSSVQAGTDASVKHHDHSHVGAGHSHDHHDHAHSHEHAHGLKGLLPHTHHHHAPSEAEANQLLDALKGSHDRGSRITLWGLLSNVVLCAAKGVAGIWLHSASLLADAGHSLSDMFADVVTLACWRLSQKPPNEMYPHGYGRYETFGSVGVSLSLVVGAIGIGAHSYTLLLDALLPTLQHAPAAIQALGQLTGDVVGATGGLLHDHADHAHALDPRAIWFALGSIGVKEWLYYATLKVARDENSNVLEANAMHHRSDSLSSGITALAIFGSWLGFPVIDPLGGLLVAGLIGKQGFDLFLVSMGELSDRSVPPPILKNLDSAIASVAHDPRNNGLVRGWRDLRATKSGVSTFVDLRLQLAKGVCLQRAWEVQNGVQEACVAAVRGVKEVRVLLEPVDEMGEVPPLASDEHQREHRHEYLPPSAAPDIATVAPMNGAPHVAASQRITHSHSHDHSHHDDHHA